MWGVSHWVHEKMVAWSLPLPISSEDRPHKVLIVRTGAMGDVLHAMPAVSAMRAQHPEWQIGWAIEPRWLPLLQNGDGTMPLVDRVHEVPTREWNRRPFSVATARSVLAVRRELRSAEYDLCVDMQGLVRSAVVGRFARAKEFVGYARPREGAARRLYSRQVATMSAHVVDRGCELLGAAIGEQLTAACVPLPRNEAAERWRDALLDEPGENGLFALLAPTAGWGAKQWPVERYGAVAAALAGAGFVPLVNAAKEHDAVAEAVKAASGGCAVPVVCDVAQMLALIRRMDVMIAGDTGPLHPGGGPGTSSGRSVWADRSATNRGPMGTRSEVIRHGSSSVDHRRHSEPEFGLAQITVDEVVEAALRVAEGSS